MFEIITQWTVIIGAIAGFILALIRLIEALKQLFERLPKQLVEFLVYAPAIVIPYFAIVWWFFYLAGLSPERLSEPGFFWAVVAQPTIGVSIYTYVWGRWIYPTLQRILGQSNSRRKPERKPNTSSASSRNGGER